MFAEPERASSNYWLNTLILAPGAGYALRDALLEGLNAAGYMARPVWTLMHRLPFHAEAPRAPLPVAEIEDAGTPLPIKWQRSTVICMH